MKLDYEEVGTCQKEVLITWDKKLLNCRTKIKCDMEDIHTSLKEGIHHFQTCYLCTAVGMVLMCEVEARYCLVTL